MKWATRQGVKSDRLACIWLITRFLDPAPEFSFVTDSEIEALTTSGVHTFDAAEARFTHSLATDGSKYGERCSFQTLAEAFGLSIENHAIARLGDIVYAADIGHRLGIFEPKEGLGLWAIAQGLSLTTPDDDARIRLALPVFDALYAYCLEKNNA